MDVEFHQVNNNLDTESCTETPMSTSAIPMSSDAALNSFSYHPGSVARSRRRRSELGSSKATKKTKTRHVLHISRRDLIHANIFLIVLAWTVAFCRFFPRH